MELDRPEAVELDRASAVIASPPSTTTPSSSKAKQFLRGVAPSNCHFWKLSSADQLGQKIYDRSMDGSERPVPNSEIDVMALNEISAHCGRGFFFHLKNRDIWKKHSTKEELYPLSRVPPPPGAQFPSILYMNYEWSKATRLNFYRSTHRSRYLACDGLINPPTDDVPLYAIQYASNAQYPLYTTRDETLIILATPTKYYLVTSLVMQQVVGHRGKGRKLAGTDSMFRLNTAPYLWQAQALANADEPQKDAYTEMQDYKCKDIRDLYNQITDKCTSEIMGSTLTAKELRAMIPRPFSPEAGVPLGVPLRSPQASNPALAPIQPIPESSNPPSRQNRRLDRGGRVGGWGTGRGRKRAKDGDDNDDQFVYKKRGN